METRFFVFSEITPTISFSCFPSEWSVWSMIIYWKVPHLTFFFFNFYCCFRPSFLPTMHACKCFFMNNWAVVTLSTPNVYVECMMYMCTSCMIKVHLNSSQNCHYQFMCGYLFSIWCFFTSSPSRLVRFGLIIVLKVHILTVNLTIALSVNRFWLKKRKKEKE